MQKQNMMNNDELDLRKLLVTLWNYKVFIISFTAVITIITIGIIFSKNPTYEAKAIIKIGEYKMLNYINTNSNTTEKKLVDDVETLSTELKVLFIDIEKNNKLAKAIVKDISLLNTDNFISITTHANNNEEAMKSINKVFSYIKNKHKTILEEVKVSRLIQIDKYQKQIEVIKTREIPQVIEKINIKNKDMLFYIESLDNLVKNISKIKNKTPTLALLEINEQRHLSDMILSIRQDLKELENKKYNLENMKLEELKENINSINSLMLPHNYKNTEIVGQIIISDNPIHPKKTIIVVIAFLTGLILSVFLVFFIQFIKSFK